MEILETANQIGEKKISIIELYQNERVIQKTGIKFVYETDLSTVELAAKACFKISNLSERPLKLCILVTQTPEDFLPATSIKLANRIKLPENCLVFDINQGCSGFVQAFCILDKLIKVYNEALLVTVDKYRTKLKPSDRSTNAVFSDGATATIIKNNSLYKILYENHYTDGSMRSLLYQSVNKKENDGFLHMSGPQIWRFTRLKVVPQIQNAINFCVSNKLKLMGIYLHQASKVVVEGISSMLDVEKSLIYETYSFYGNTVSSSIPFMFEKYPIDLRKKNSVLIMAGFGVGLTSAVIVYGNKNA
jgi:3-oxoacyl-[acyl-carrier-protein] synthase-3